MNDIWFSNIYSRDFDDNESKKVGFQIDLQFLHLLSKKSMCHVLLLFHIICDFCCYFLFMTSLEIGY
jgi:hypothetical protein